jgi:hypothetical protein
MMSNNNDYNVIDISGKDSTERKKYIATTAAGVYSFGTKTHRKSLQLLQYHLLSQQPVSKEGKQV